VLSLDAVKPKFHYANFSVTFVTSLWHRWLLHDKTCDRLRFHYFSLWQVRYIPKSVCRVMSYRARSWIPLEWRKRACRQLAASFSQTIPTCWDSLKARNFPMTATYHCPHSQLPCDRPKTYLWHMSWGSLKNLCNGIWALPDVAEFAKKLLQFSL